MNVEWALLADYVELSGNKLYMMGGGWDTLTINNPLLAHSFGVLASFRAELHELDRPHEVAVQIVHVDTETTIVNIQGSIEFAGLPRDSKMQTELAHFGLNLTLSFQNEGLFHLVIRIENQVRKIFPFHVSFGASLREIVPSSGMGTPES